MGGGSIPVFVEALRLGWTDFKVFWTWKSWLGSWLLRTLSSAMTWTLVGRMLGDPQALTYLLVGNAVLAGPSSVCWTIAASTWDRFDGTYSLQVISPSSLWPMIAGRAFIWVLNGIVTSWVVFAVLGIGFGLPFPARAMLLVPPLVIVVCLTTFGFSLFVGAFVARVPRLRIMINFGTTNALMALSGVSVPTSFWPAPIAAMARYLPVTNGLRAVRLCFSDGPLREVAAYGAREFVTGAAWWVLSSLAIDRLADHGRADGSIDFVG
jgi:ABC-2 type transport system permease protein